MNVALAAKEIVYQRSFCYQGKGVFFVTKKDGKPCKKCGGTEWYKNSTCKQCNLEHERRWRAENLDKALEGKRRRYSENQEKELVRGRRWRAENPDKHRESTHRWRRSNPERHREQERKRGRRWAKNNPDKVNDKTQRRRAQKRGNGGSYTAAEWKSLCEQYDNCCLSCGKKVRLTPDHVIPVSKGGTSNISNIQPLCLSCNCSKQDKTTDYRTKPGIIRWIQEKLLS